MNRIFQFAVFLVVGSPLFAMDFPVVRLHAEVSQTHEASGFALGARVAVVREGDLANSLELPIQISGTAVAGDDYVPIPSSVHFAPGQRFARIMIDPVDDDVDEGPETIRIALTQSPTYQLGPVSSQSATITIAGEISPALRSIARVIGPEQSKPQWIGNIEVTDSVTADVRWPVAMAHDVIVGEHAHPWEAGPVWSLPRTFEEGDQVLVGFWAKGSRPVQKDAGATEPARLTVRVQCDRPGYDGAEQTFDLTPQWAPYLFRAEMPADLQAGQSSLSLRLGYGQQQVSIADCQLWNFGRSRQPHLPQPIFNYNGRDVDAPWRETLSQSANERTHYEVGTAVNPRWVSSQTSPLALTGDAEIYRSIVLKHFDRITDENGQQWISWITDSKPATDLSQWAVANGLKVRGHSVMWGDPIKWPSPPDLWKNYQSILKTRGEQAAVLYLRNRVADHVRSDALVALNGTVDSTNGVTDQPIIAEWDVVNHPILHREMWDITGWEFLRAAIREARSLAHPKTNFFINEDQVLSSPNHVNAAPLAAVIADFVKRQVPIDGIGFQGHFKSHQLPTFDGIQRTLDRFANYGLKLHVTEFDIDDRFIDEQTQADFTRDFLDLCAAHPAVDALIVWGFWEGEHWRSEEGAAMWTKDWTLRPNGQVFIDHVDRLKRGQGITP